jgi:hypothetical protein
MESTDWDSYGTGRYEKCANCMVHCGYEGTAVSDTVARPWKAAKVALLGIRTEGEMAPEIPLNRQRPAKFMFDSLVDQAVSGLHQSKSAKAGGSKSSDQAA